MAGGPTRQDTYTVTLTVIDNGQNIDFGIWDKLEGGAIDSEETKYYPGGMRPQVSLGGRRTTDNITIRRLYRLARDHDEAQRFINWAGRTSVVVTKQPMDIDANPYGKPIVYNGTLKRVEFPDHDSESSNAGMLSLEITVDGQPTS